MIKQFDIVISGFTQTRAKPAGLDTIFTDLQELSSPERYVNYCSWKDDFDAVAEFMFRISEGTKPIIRIYAYSWGCGHGFVALSRALAKRGLRVKCAALCDPVWCGLLCWEALISWHIKQIPKPDNVDKVVYIRQQMNKPSGVEVVGGEFKGFLPYTHQNIDDSPEYRALCKEVANAAD